MTFHPLLALFSPEILAIVIGAAVILFGAEKLPKLARSAGEAKREFLVGQAEAEEAAERAREQARLRAQAQHADVMENVGVNNADGVGQNVPPPTPDKGTLSS